MITNAANRGDGQPRLSPRLAEVARYILDGLQTKQIAQLISRDRETVKSHKKKLKDVFGVATVRELTDALKQHLAAPAQVARADDPLVGYWLSRYDFESYVEGSSPAAFRQSAQINIELIEADTGGMTHRGHSVCGVRKHGGAGFEHDLHLLLKRQLVVGFWENSNSDNVGCFQLRLENPGNTMSGMHLGNTSNLVIKHGHWVWLRLDGQAPPVRLTPGSLLPFAELDALVSKAWESNGIIRFDQVLR